MTASMGSECDVDGIRVGLAGQFADAVCTALAFTQTRTPERQGALDRYTELSAQGRQR